MGAELTVGTAEVFRASDLEVLASAVLRAAGAPPATADAVAGHLVGANLAGHDSHGIQSLVGYVGAIREGKLFPSARPIVEEDQGAALLVSGEWGFGQVAGQFAMDAGIERARQHGVSAVGIVRTWHLGRFGTFMEQATRSGCIAMGWLGGLGTYQGVAPFGGSQKLFGTNPFTAGFPAGDAGTVLLDFATSNVAGNRVMMAMEEGKEVPPGVLIDRDGNPTTDPSALMNGGALLPFGGHKGYGLAVLGELLSVALTGAGQTGGEEHGDTFGRHGALFVVVAGDAFRPINATVRAAEDFVQALRASPPAKGFDRVLAPGDPEALARASRGRQGIPLPSRTWSSLVSIARDYGILDADLPRPV